MARRALWNSSVIVSSVRALLGLFGVEFAFTIANIQKVLNHSPGDVHDAGALRSLYSRLPIIDLSQDILRYHASRLRMIAVPDCGWTDLGTPSRVARALADLQLGESNTELDGGVLDLAIQSRRVAPAHSAQAGFARQ